MQIASKSGSRKAHRYAWHSCDRTWSRPGPRTLPRRCPFAQLTKALQSLIHFHESHPFSALGRRWPEAG